MLFVIPKEITKKINHTVKEAARELKQYTRMYLFAIYLLTFWKKEEMEKLRGKRHKTYIIENKHQNGKYSKYITYEWLTSPMKRQRLGNGLKKEISNFMLSTKGSW